jgi:hypothetical protein
MGNARIVATGTHVIVPTESFITLRQLMFPTTIMIGRAQTVAAMLPRRTPTAKEGIL